MTSSPEQAVRFALPEFSAGPGARRPAPGVQQGTADGGLLLPELESVPGRGGLAPHVTEADEAYERGFAAGLREGDARAQERVRNALELLGRVGEYLHTAQSAFVRDRARDLHGLALAVARRLVQRELTADPELVRELVARALDLVPLEAQLDIRVHPDDVPVLESAPPAPTSEGGAPSIQWVPDPTIERGSFVVETPMRIVDGRTDFALRSLYERLEYE